VEDEGFVDDDSIEETAREYVGRYGLNSIFTLRERAGIAEVAGELPDSPNVARDRRSGRAHDGIG
jgi:hypothetical protein